MTKFQLIRSDNILHSCVYCGHKLSGWKSEFLVNVHYKVCSCTSCKKKISIKVDFMGSGHDDWEKNNKCIDDALV